MFKKIFAIATVMCVIPMMANATTKWSLATRAMSQGGVIDSRNMTGQTVYQGSIFKQYTTTSNLTVTVKPNPGFKISKISNNGLISVPGTLNPATLPIVATAGVSNAIQATFARVGYTITATAGAGGTVDKSGYPVVYAGVQSPVKSFIFTPNPGQFVQSAVATGTGVVYQNLNAITGLPVTLPAAVGVKVKTNITTVGTANVVVAGTFSANATPPSTATAAKCDGCHASQGVGLGVYNNWSTSVHKKVANPIVSCAGCHAGADAGVHPGNLQCTGCHSGYNSAEVTKTAACFTCHQPNGDTETDPHRFQVANKDFGCVDCHAAVINHPGTTVSASQNAGVRNIMAEFGKNSHHISSGTPTNEQCAMCHLEGMKDPANPTKVTIDETYHLADGTIHLRNGNTGLTANSTAVELNWNPAAPNHANMDKFCFGCHNAAGPVTALAALDTAKPAGATAAQPFGIPVTNGYDTLVRPAVVNVFDQFATTNVTHHAVRGAKYTNRTRTVANAAVFNANSSAANPGVRKTIYDAGLFVATYTPLGAALSVADNSVLHCGDCHTVGQFKAGSTTNADGVPTTEVIGAHGSVNEYMLRTSTGADTLHHQADTPQANTAPFPTNGDYVCFLCHAQKSHEEGGYNAMGFHAGMEGSNGSYCNGRAAESVGLTGFGGTFTTTYDATGKKTGQSRVPNIIGTASGGNVFGYSCAHCHNAGQNNTFGGIHGGNTSYKSYSASNGPASATNASFQIVKVQPFRFMGGLSLRYQGGGGAAGWEKKVQTQANREGCYNQSTVANTATKVKLWGPGAPLDVNGVADDTAVNPNAGGANGTWGSCAHHNGSTTSGGGRAITRVGVQRPLSY